MVAIFLAYGLNKSLPASCSAEKYCCCTPMDLQPYSTDLHTKERKKVVFISIANFQHPQIGCNFCYYYINGIGNKEKVRNDKSTMRSKEI